MKALELLPIGNFDDELLLNWVRRSPMPFVSLRNHFRPHGPCLRLPPRTPPVPFFGNPACHAGHRYSQHLARSGNRRGRSLYPDLTFVFGEAQMGGPCAVVSLHRLRQQFYGLPEDRRCSATACGKRLCTRSGTRSTSPTATTTNAPCLPRTLSNGSTSRKTDSVPTAPPVPKPKLSGSQLPSFFLLGGPMLFSALPNACRN